jgi:hypothetical protein
MTIIKQQILQISICIGNLLVTSALPSLLVFAFLLPAEIRPITDCGIESTLVHLLVPTLPELLDIQGANVMNDAIGCQKTIAKRMALLPQ